MSYQESNLYKMRHTAAHVLAQAVLEMYPEAKLGIGPPIEDGFYYDFDLGVAENGRLRTFKPDDLPALEARMRQIFKERHPLQRREVCMVEAKKIFHEQPYKLELLEGLAEAARGQKDDASVFLYRHDSFEDLCRGPHVAHTGQLPVNGLKLMSVAAAYWQGDEKRPMLQRIYGTLWPNKKQLKQYLAQLEEAKQRDHRKLGRELEIYLLDDEVGPGLPLWLPNGRILRDELEKLAWEDGIGRWLSARIHASHR